MKTDPLSRPVFVPVAPRTHGPSAPSAPPSLVRSPGSDAHIPFSGKQSAGSLAVIRDVLQHEEARQFAQDVKKELGL